ncbi:hypothetical protein V1503_19035 [Bacillus sp. SCS-151]|uniref:hypothetical protein n=1 Tax=Nanhaiella sioensis TaxID=3115293 RepID=UPI003978FDD4
MIDYIRGLTESILFYLGGIVVILVIIERIQNIIEKYLNITEKLNKRQEEKKKEQIDNTHIDKKE